MKLSNREIVTIFLMRMEKTHEWLANTLGVSRHTVLRRLEKNNWRPEEVEKLKENGCELNGV